MRYWLTRRFVVYRWPTPLVVLFAALAFTNPQPYLLTDQGFVQRALFTAAATASLLATLWPRRLALRDALAFSATAACGYRAMTLIGHPGRYDDAEVIAYATVWVVIGTLVIQMIVLTWPTVMFDRSGRVDAARR